MDTSSKKDFCVDIIINAGELDKSGYRFKDNDMKHHEVVKHNVLYSEFMEWIHSAERWDKQRALEAKAIERWGEEHWKHYEVCCFCTSAAKD